jgi:type II secretion system protein J
MEGPVNSPTLFKRTGFTLVELLVVLMITVLLIGSAATMLRSVAHGREVVDKRLQGEEAATMAMRTIITALRNAYRPITDNDIYFEGIQEQADPEIISRVRFRGLDRRIIRQGQPESDVKTTEFFLREEGTSYTLMRRTDPTINPPPDTGGVVEPLATDIVGLDFQYLDAGQWLDRWPETQKRWPTAVNVTITYVADESTHRHGSVSRLVNFPYWSSTSGGAATP